MAGPPASRSTETVGSLREDLSQHSLAVGGRLKLTPDHVCQQPPATPHAPLVGEQGGDVIQERRGDHDVAVLVRAAIAEDDALSRSRDARVQQVALAVERIARLRQREPGAESEFMAAVVAEERVGDGSLRTRELVRAQARHEHSPEASGADRERLGDQHRARGGGPCAGTCSALEHLDQLGGGRALVAELLELLERLENSCGGARIELLRSAKQRSAAAVGCRQQLTRAVRQDGTAVGGKAQLLEQ